MLFKMAGIFLVAIVISVLQIEVTFQADPERSVSYLIDKANDTIATFFNDVSYKSLPYMFMGYINAQSGNLLDCGTPTRMMKINQSLINHDIKEKAKTCQRLSHEDIHKTQEAYTIANYNGNLIKDQKNLWFAAWSDNCFVSRASYNRVKKSKNYYNPHYEEYFAAYMNKSYNGIASNRRMVAFSSKKPCDYTTQDCATIHSCTDVVKLIAAGRDASSGYYWNKHGEDMKKKFLYVSAVNVVNTAPKYGYLNWFAGSNEFKDINDTTTSLLSLIGHLSTSGSVVPQLTPCIIPVGLMVIAYFNL